MAARCVPVRLCSVYRFKLPLQVAGCVCSHLLVQSSAVVQVPLVAVGPPTSPYYVWAVSGARRPGPSAATQPLLPDAQYEVRVVYNIVDPSVYAAATGARRLESPWCHPVTTKSEKCVLPPSLCLCLLLCSVSRCCVLASCSRC